MNDYARACHLMLSGDLNAARKVRQEARRRNDKDNLHKACLLLHPTETMYHRSVILKAWANEDEKMLEFCSTALGFRFDKKMREGINHLIATVGYCPQGRGVALSDILRVIQGAMAKYTHWDVAVKDQNLSRFETRRLILAHRHNGTVVCGIGESVDGHPHPGLVWKELSPWGWTSDPTTKGDQFKRLSKWAEDPKEDRVVVSLLS